MNNADYLTVLKNGIDAARTGSRGMAKLQLMKAADRSTDDVAGHLWLAYVAETPSDALAHFDDALSRQPNHALAKLGRFWTQMLVEFDPARDYSSLDLSSLHASSADAGALKTAGAGHMRKSHAAGQPGADDPRNSDPRNGAPKTDATPTHDVSAGANRDEDEFNGTQTVRLSSLPKLSYAADGEEDVTKTCIIPRLSHLVAQAREDTARTDVAMNESPVADPSDVGGDAVPSHGDSQSADVVNAHANAPLSAVPETGDAQYKNNSAPADESSPIAVPQSSSGEPFPGHEAPAPLAAEVAQPAEPPLTGPRILVVDESPTVRKLVTRTLEARGCRVDCCPTGYDAVQWLAHSTPDAVVTEVDLPRLDGLTLCKLLRTQAASRETPVVFLSRRATAMDKVRGRLAGGTAYLTKPFRPQTLVDQLAACLPTVQEG